MHVAERPDREGDLATLLGEARTRDGERALRQPHGLVAFAADASDDDRVGAQGVREVFRPTDLLVDRHELRLERPRSRVFATRSDRRDDASQRERGVDVLDADLLLERVEGALGLGLTPFDLTCADERERAPGSDALAIEERRLRVAFARIERDVRALERGLVSPVVVVGVELVFEMRVDRGARRPGGVRVRHRRGGCRRRRHRGWTRARR